MVTSARTAWSGAINVDLSGDAPNLAAAVPVVALDPTRQGHIAIAWRFIDPIGGSNAASAGNWVCHLSTSVDDGRTFKDQALHWRQESTPRCNAPWVGFSARGALYVAATLTGMPPSPATADAQTGGAAAGGAAAGGSAVPHPHPKGTAGLMVSHDGGATWDAMVSVIPSDALDRFETDESIPVEAKRVPWDGARGAIDPATGTIYISGAFPAPPGAPQHSQRFFSASTDAGKTFGPIRAFADADWPERWDGDLAAAGGVVALSYIADSTPDRSRHCPCAVVAFSEDRGKTLVRRLLADSDAFDLDTLVHYPEMAANAAHAHGFAVALVAKQRFRLSAFVTDDGKKWAEVTPSQPAEVESVTRPALAFSTRGVLVLVWRGVHADGSYDIYAAASTDRQSFGGTVKVTNASSRTPESWRRTYAVRGDFHTSAAVDGTDAHLAWADARSGQDVRIYYARVPLGTLERQDTRTK